MNHNKKIIKYILNLKKLKNFEIIDDNCILFKKGKNIIPFDFLFSNQFKPCFEYPFPPKRAHLRQDFCIKLNSQYSFTESSAYLCIILRPIMTEKKTLNKSINQQIKKWKLFEEGQTKLDVSVSENNYKYDSICKVNILIDNTYGKANAKEYKVKFLRKIEFKDDKGNIKYNDETIIQRDIVNAYVKSGSKRIFEYNLNLEEKSSIKRYNYIKEIPPYNIEMNKINYYMPTIHGKIIYCDYELKISLYFDCFVAKKDRPRIIIPIFIVHQLPLDYQLEIQEQIDYENAIRLSKIENLNNKKTSVNNLVNNKIINYRNNDDNNIKNNDNYINIINNKIIKDANEIINDKKLEDDKSIINNKIEVENNIIVDTNIIQESNNITNNLIETGKNNKINNNIIYYNNLKENRDKKDIIIIKNIDNGEEYIDKNDNGDEENESDDAPSLNEIQRNKEIKKIITSHEDLNIINNDIEGRNKEEIKENVSGFNLF